MKNELTLLALDSPNLVDVLRKLREVHTGQTPERAIIDEENDFKNIRAAAERLGAKYAIYHRVFDKSEGVNTSYLEYGLYVPL